MLFDSDIIVKGGVTQMILLLCKKTSTSITKSNYTGHLKRQKITHFLSFNTTEAEAIIHVNLILLYS